MDFLFNVRKVKELCMQSICLIEDGLRGRTTARPPLVNGLGLNRRLLEADFGSGLDGLRHTLEALGGILEAF